MKRCALCVIALALLFAPPAASAQEPPACAITTTGDPGEAFGRMGWLAQPVAKDLEAWLGEQFAVFWVQSREFRWYVGIAPGPITAEQLRERALELVDARYDGEDAEMLRANLGISEQPYGEAELRRIQDELSAKAVERRWGVGWANGVGCRHTDAWRVEFELFSDATPEIVAEARALAEPYGDKVRVVHSADTPPPRADFFAESSTPRIADLVRVRGCRVVLRRSARRTVRSLKVRRTGRRSASVRVRLKDGRDVRGTVRLRSCARS